MPNSFSVCSGQGKVRENHKTFSITRESRNIDYLPIVRESQGI